MLLPQEIEKIKESRRQKIIEEAQISGMKFGLVVVKRRHLAALEADTKARERIAVRL